MYAVIDWCTRNRYAFRQHVRIKNIISNWCSHPYHHHLVSSNTIGDVSVLMSWAWFRLCLDMMAENNVLHFYFLYLCCTCWSCRFSPLCFLLCQPGPLWDDLSPYFSLWPWNCEIVYSRWQKGKWISLICLNASLAVLFVLIAAYSQFLFYCLHPGSIFRLNSNRSKQAV